MAKKLETEEVEKVTLSSVDEDMKKVEMDGVKVRKPQAGSIAAKQLAYFANQEKVRYIYPRASGEKRGSFETYIVNDLMITVEKGVPVNLPEDIAMGFDNSRQVTDAAVEQNALKDLPSELQK